MENLLVIGLRVEKYIGQNIEGHNCNFHYFDEEMERYHVYLRTPSNELYRVSLENQYGECGSGWCTASWGLMEVEKLEAPEPFTHRPKKTPLYIEGEFCPNEYGDLKIIGTERSNEDDFNSEVFNCWEIGGDPYYPSGGVNVNMDLFVPLKRAMDKRPVFIFCGDSGLGKSTLASKTNMVVFETDAVDELPEEISADIVVVGNKRNFNIDEIVSKLIGDPEVIFVKFSKS